MAVEPRFADGVKIHASILLKAHDHSSRIYTSIRSLLKIHAPLRLLHSLLSIIVLPVLVQGIAEILQEDSLAHFSGLRWSHQALQFALGFLQDLPHGLLLRLLRELEFLFKLILQFEMMVLACLGLGVPFYFKALQVIKNWHDIDSPINRHLRQALLPLRWICKLSLLLHLVLLELDEQVFLHLIVANVREY